MSKRAVIFSVCGIEWRAKALGKKKYMKQADGDDKSVAITIMSRREILFLKRQLTIKNVIHEVFHAHAAYLHINNWMDLSLSDYEEIIAGMLEERIYPIIEISQHIFKTLKKIN